MRLFKGKTPEGPTEGQMMQANNIDVERQVKADRAFWDETVRWMLNEDDTADMAVKRAVDVADKLLELRRERFPVKD